QDCGSVTGGPSPDEDPQNTSAVDTSVSAGNVYCTHCTRPRAPDQVNIGTWLTGPAGAPPRPPRAPGSAIGGTTPSFSARSPPAPTGALAELLAASDGAN